MANALNDLGFGLAALVNTYGQFQDRGIRQRMLESNLRAQERQDALAQATLGIQSRRMDQMDRELQREQEAMTNLPKMLAAFGRLGGGGNALASSPASAPSGQQPSPGVSQWGDLISYWGRYHGLTPEQQSVIPRIMSVESGGNPWAHNKANKNGTDDFGLMQINSGNMGRVTQGQNVFDPSENIRIGTQMFKELVDKNNGDIRAALGAYNTGKANPNAPYVDKVLGGAPMGNNTLAAGGNTASDMPQGYGMQGGGYKPMTPEQMDMLATWDMSPSKFLQHAAKVVREKDKAMREAAGWGFGLDGEAKNLAHMLGRMPTQQELVEYKRQTNPQNTVNVTTTQEKEESKEYGKLLVKRLEGTLQDADAAAGELQQIAAAQSLGVETGPLESFKAQAGATMAAFGIKPETVGLNNMNEIGKTQAYQATVNNMVLKRAEAMKGNLSDKDVKFLKETVSGLDKTPQANAILLGVAERVARRKIEKADFMQRYRESNGSLDGAEKAFRAWADENPVFEGMQIPGKRGASQAAPGVVPPAAQDPLGIR